MNDEYGMTPENLMRSLPDALKKDESMNALAVNIAQVLSKRAEEIESLMIYSQIDQLPEELLDILAYDFNITWWDRALDIDAKRKMIKESWHVRKHLGTKYAVELAVSAAFGSGVVSEWFEYGGEPYHFRITFVELRKVLENYGTFLDMLEAVKRKSAVLDSLTAMKAVESTVYVGAAMRTGKIVTLTMDAIDTTSYIMLEDENGEVLLDGDGTVILDG